MIRRLDLYVIRSIAGPTLLVMFTLMVVSSIMSLVDELEAAERLGYGFGVTLQFVLLSLPAGIYQLAPTTMLLGALLGLGTLASGSELIVMRASGVSLTRLAFATAFGGVGFAILIFALGDWLVPVSYQTAYDLRTEARHGGHRSGESGLWLREGDRYIHIDKIHGKTALGTVHEYAFDDKRRLTSNMEAKSGVYTKNVWQLADVRESLVQDQRITTRKEPVKEWDVQLDPSLLQLSAVRSESLSSGGLWSYARYLDSNGLDADDYWAAWWRKLAMPLTIIVMSLMAIPFVVGSLRSAGNGQRLFVGILMGIGFYLLNEIVGSTGQVYGMQPWATALLPTLLVGALALFWLDRIN